MRYVIVIATIAFTLIWDGLYNGGQWLDEIVRALNHGMTVILNLVS